MNNVFKYKCVSNLQVKPGYTRKSPGIPEKYPSARPHAAHALLPGSLRQLRRAPPAQVRAPHHVCSLQVPKGSIGAAPGTACRRRCGRRGRANILLQDRGGARHALVRPRSTDRKEAAQQADCCRHTICYLTRCEFGEDEHDSGFTDTRWVELEELYENCGSQD